MSRRWNFEKAKEFVHAESNGECELLSISKKNNRDYMDVRCKCKGIFQVQYYHFKNGKHQCNKCSGKHKTSIVEVKNYVDVNTSCQLISSEYINNGKPLIFKCSCGNEFETTFKIFKKGKQQCDNCTNKVLSEKFCKTEDYFKSEVWDLVKEEYSVIGKYKNRKIKVKMKHNVCGCEWYANPSDFLFKNSRCPKCNESKGERAISSWLLENNIYFETEYKIDECRNKRALPFDFAIIENNRVKLLIEYDGKQHYLEGCFNKNSLKKIQKNDQIKTIYCEKNNIPLLRIPYKKFNDIPVILERTLL